MCQVSHVTCQVLCVMCHVSGAMCHAKYFFLSLSQNYQFCRVPKKVACIEKIFLPFSFWTARSVHRIIKVPL